MRLTMRESIQSILVAAPFYGVLGISPAIAQTASSAEPTETVEEIVVTGVRGSVQRALAQKRAATGFADAISAEDIGKFPDLNLSESLQRIPGVTLNRNVNGEGQAINVRGLGPEFTRVEVNGMSGTDNGTGGRFGTSGGGRGFNFEVLASELFSNAIVSKSSSAKQVEGGLAGTIKLETPKPLSYNGLRFSVSGQGNYSDVTGDTDPRMAAFISNNIDDRWGIAASLAYSEVFFRSDTVEAGVWRPLGNVAGVPLVANGTRLYNFIEDRESLGGTLTLQARPNDGLELTFDAIIANLDNERIANRDDMPIEGGQTGVPGTLTIDNGIVTSGDFAGVQQRVGTNYFTTDEEFQQYTLKAEFRPNDSWSIMPFVGFSTREADRIFDLYSFRLADPLTNTFDPGIVSYQLRGDFVDFGSDTTDFVSNPEDFLFNVFILRPSNDKDEETALQLDFERFFSDAGGLQTVDFGVRYSDRTKERIQTQERLQRTEGTGIEVPPNLSSVATTLELSVDGADPGLPEAILAADPGLVRSVFYPGGNAVSGTFIRPLPGFGAQNSWEIEEKTFNAYVQANFEIGRAVFDVGLRYVDTSQTSSGFTVENIFQPSERITPLSVDNDYTEFLPSANLRFELKDDMYIRAAYSRTLTRADLPALAPSESILGISEVDGGTGSRGNPLLQPFTADNLDLGFEWYFGTEDVFAVAYFRKEINNLIDTTTFTEAREFPRQADGVLVTGDILFTEPANGATATIDGFELSVQKAFLENYGVLFNYTVTDSSADFGVENDVRSTGLPGLSETSLNASAYFDNGTFDARITYAWRENYLAQFSDDFGVPRFIDDYGQLDLQANWHVKENLTVQFQALNVTGEQQINQATSELLPYGVTEFDRRILFGARYTF